MLLLNIVTGNELFSLCQEWSYIRIHPSVLWYQNLNKLFVEPLFLRTFYLFFLFFSFFITMEGRQDETAPWLVDETQIV